MKSNSISIVLFYIELLTIAGICHRIWRRNDVRPIKDFTSAEENDKCRIRYYTSTIDERILRYQKKGILSDERIMESADFYWPSPYDIQETRFSTTVQKKRDHLSHLGNTEELLQSYVTNEYTDMRMKISNAKCTHCLSDILKKHHDILFYPCRDNRVFAHCQRHYLVSYSTQTKKWSPYIQTESLQKTTMYDVTLVTHLTLDRQDRLPYLLDRWDGPIVLVVALSMQEIEDIDAFIRTIKKTNDLLLHLYIRENDVYNNCDDNYIININKKMMFKDCHTTPIYPINLLRAIGIGSISTSHFALIDVDLFVSNTLRRNFLKLPKSLLEDSKSVFMYPAFAYNVTNIQQCVKDQNCEAMWATISKTKSELVPLLRKKELHLIDTKYHQIINTSFWTRSKDGVFKIKCLESSIMEPYFITRRNPSMNYHPYFVNYGFNKMEYFSRLHYEGFSFYVLMQDFGIDIPHEKSQYSMDYRVGVKAKRKENKDVMYKMAMLYKEYMNSQWKDMLPICNTTK